MTDTIGTHVQIGVRRLAGNIGAEITGVDTGTELGDDTVAQIRQALLEHKVVFLRDQRLNYRQAGGVRRAAGPAHPRPPDAGVSAGSAVPGGDRLAPRAPGPTTGTPTSPSWTGRLPSRCCTRVVIPPVGGDTIWANTVTAYQSLPAELRDLADRLRIVHTNDYDYAAVAYRGERADAALQAKRQEFVSTVYETEHPAVRVHPETAERSLVLGGFARIGASASRRRRPGT